MILWSGLGYNNRAIRLHESSKILSKKGFERFFLKEINDTEIFLKRTINNYISFNKKQFKNLNNIFNVSTLNKSRVFYLILSSLLFIRIKLKLSN